MELERTRLPLAGRSTTYTPTPISWLNAMTLRAEVPPPMALLDESTTDTPSELLPRAPAPLAAVPIRLPWTLLPPDRNPASPEMNTPASPLPEMTLRAASEVPPTVLLDARTMFTPSRSLPKALVPLAVVPMRLPWTVLSTELSEMRTPDVWLAEMTLRALRVVPPTVLLRASKRLTPSIPFPRPCVPPALVPIKLPSTLLLSAVTGPRSVSRPS